MFIICLGRLKEDEEKGWIGSNEEEDTGEEEARGLKGKCEYLVIEL